MDSLFDRPVSVADVYYLLERWSTLTVWNALNLERPGEKKLMILDGASPHYHVYDCGSALIAAPKDLFSHARTLADALSTARAVAHEVYRREWVIEFAGFEKMERALWVELQHLGDERGRKIDIMNYEPTFKELRVYVQEAKEQALKRAEQL